MISVAMRSKQQAIGATRGTDQAAVADVGARRLLAGLLRSCRWGAADEAEVLAAAARIRDRNPESWVSEWVWSAGEVWSAANQAASPGRGAGAGALYLRAATYYGAALSQVARSAEHHRAAALWRRQRFCWDRAAQRLGGERLEIPYSGASLPAYFFPASGPTGRRRPLVIMHNGASAPTSAMWGLGGAAAAVRGYHWMTFDGPGQQAALYQRGLWLRPDWEAVFAAVLDAILDRPDVDASRVASVGVGQAGYLLPRALAHEHRLAAAVVAPGVVDVATALIDALPPRVRTVLGDAAFDRELHAELLFEPGTARWLKACALPYGLADAPPSLLFSALARYRIDGDAAGIRTPLLIADPGLDTPWQDQSRRLSGHVGAHGSLVDAPPAEREARAFGWLEGILGG
jgi:Esterase FrsA-like